MPRPSQTRATVAQVRDKAERSSVHFQKTKMCKFHLNGVCTRGSRCSWAHDPDELKALPDFYRTKLCHTYLSKGACRNTDCRYAHGYHELRTTDGQELMDNGSNGHDKYHQTDSQGYPVQWAASDMQFTFMQMIPFSPAMTMIEMPMPVSQRAPCEDGNGKRRSSPVDCLSRQTTATGLAGEASTSEDGDLWAGGSDNSSGGDTPTQTFSQGASEPTFALRDLDETPAAAGIEAHDVVVRVRNTFLEFGEGAVEQPSVSRRCRARSLDGRICA
mmetsp:Transcript_80070/g.210292  ORF Transcript_80070/g.210292 Transcript_80070/m.210292 type:complete len:273 (+) Transcript_80070:94-912(+)